MNAMNRLRLNSDSTQEEIIHAIKKEVGTTEKSIGWFPHYNDDTKDVLMVISCNDDGIRKVCEAFDYLKQIDVIVFVLGLKSYEDLEQIREIAKKHNDKCYEITRLFDNVFYVFEENDNRDEIEINFKIKDKEHKWSYIRNDFCSYDPKIKIIQQGDGNS